VAPVQELPYSKPMGSFMEFVEKKTLKIVFSLSGRAKPGKLLARNPKKWVSGGVL